MRIAPISSPSPVTARAATAAPMPGGPSDAFDLRGQEWRPKLPPGLKTQAPAPPPTPLPEVGSQRSFFVWDLSVMPPATREVSATCRSVGPDAYIFVDDAVWDRLVSEGDVETLRARFEDHSPSGSVDPRLGVGPIDHDYFGRPPLGLDNDPKAYLLLTEMAEFNGTRLDGYFNPFDTITDQEAQQYGQRSNEKEVLYLNAASAPIASDYMQGVMAHEYQHLLNNQFDAEEESWLSETLAEVAMKVNGYHTDIGHIARHQAHPERPLVSQTYVDYGACMLFGTYMTERFGKSFIQELARDGAHGVDSINGTLERFGRPERFADLYRDWVVTNYLDSRPVSVPGLQYASLDVPRPAETALETGQTRALELKPTGAGYLRIPESGGNLHIEAGSGLTAELLRFDGNRVERVGLDPGAGDIALQAHPDQILVLGSLAAEPLTAQVTVGSAPPPQQPPSDC